MTKLPFILLAALLQLAGVEAQADVVAVVAADSDIRNLSASEIADIFLGKRARFPDGRTAIPIDQPEGSAQRTAFYARYAEKTPAEMKMHWSKLIFTGRGQPPRQVPDAEAVKLTLAEQPNAIGYLERSFVDDSLAILE